MLLPLLVQPFQFAFLDASKKTRISLNFTYSHSLKFPHCTHYWRLFCLNHSVKMVSVMPVNKKGAITSSCLQASDTTYFVSDFPDSSMKPHFLLRHLLYGQILYSLLSIWSIAVLLSGQRCDCWCSISPIVALAYGWEKVISFQFWPDIVKQSQENICEYKLHWKLYALILFWITQSTLL